MKIKEDRQGILACVLVNCYCNRLVLKSDRKTGVYHCSRCGRELDYHIPEDSVREILGRNSAKNDQVQFSETSNVNLQRKIRELEEQLSAANEESRKFKNRYLEINSAFEKESIENTRLNSSIRELEKKLEDSRISMEKQSADKISHMDDIYNSRIASIKIELSQWQKAHAELKEKTKALMQEIDPLRSKNAYLETELKRSKTLKVRDIVEMFIEYISGIYNAALDIKDAEALSDMIHARTEKVIMLAQGYGIDILRSDRGQSLRDGRIDIDCKTTDDPSLDGKIIKSRQFGCVFKDDVETEIPEKVLIWMFNDSKKSVPSEETPAMAGKGEDRSLPISEETGLSASDESVTVNNSPSNPADSETIIAEIGATEVSSDVQVETQRDVDQTASAEVPSDDAIGVQTP